LTASFHRSLSSSDDPIATALERQQGVKRGSSTHRNSCSKPYFRSPSPPSLPRARMFRERYQLARQRVMRNELFVKPIMGHDRNYLKLVTVDSLLGTHGMSFSSSLPLHCSPSLNHPLLPPCHRREESVGVHHAGRGRPVLPRRLDWYGPREGGREEEEGYKV